MHEDPRKGTCMSKVVRATSTSLYEFYSFPFSLQHDVRKPEYIGNERGAIGLIENCAPLHKSFGVRCLVRNYRS